MACMCHTCIVRDAQLADVEPCHRPYAVENWWVEPDLYREAFDTKDEYNEAVKVAREDLVRGQLYCWSECPLLWDCLQAGLDERYHIWGGLSAGERQRVRKNDGILPSAESVDPDRQDGSTRTKVTEMFREGAGVSEIAVTIGRSEKTVWDHIRGSLAAARSTREDTEPWESHPTKQLSTKNECRPGPEHSLRSETQERMAS